MGLNRLILILLAGLVLAAPVAAQDSPTPSGFPVPRYVSLKAGVANGRAGPEQAHPIVWRYMRAGLPMEVIAETPDWRRVRDPEGEITWMHRTLLSARRSVIALDDLSLLARPALGAPVEAVAETGAVLWLERCRDGWCRVEAQGHRGWAEVSALWGLYDEERDGVPAAAQRSPALSASAPHDTAPG